MENKGLKTSEKFLVLGIVICIPLIAVLASLVTGKLGEMYPLLFSVVVLLFTAAYTAVVAGHLYKFYSLDREVIQYIPLLNDFCFVDYRARIALYVLYGIFAILMALVGFNFLPGGLPVIVTIIAIFVMVVAQIIIGVNMISIYVSTDEYWKKVSGYNSGLLRIFMLSAFVPVVRVLYMYALEKVLVSMVVMSDLTAQDIDEREEENSENITLDE